MHDARRVTDLEGGGGGGAGPPPGRGGGGGGGAGSKCWGWGGGGGPVRGPAWSAGLCFMRYLWGGF
ncbi:hypothetical protein [Mesorhizobium ciceri]|uniref:hypothetical protein n=1 Tax=Mesorhizobium ciceri TaxID=39645 RepID=UPI00344C26A0